MVNYYYRFSLLANLILPIICVFHISDLNDKLYDQSLRGSYVSQNAFYSDEGPFWDPNTQTLFHVDTFFGDIIETNVTTGQSTRLNIGNYIGVVIPVHNQPGKLVVSKRNILIEVDWPSRTFKRLSTNHVGRYVGEKFNDGKVDARGRLWVNTMIDKDYYDTDFDALVPNAGGLYRLDGRTLTQVDDGYTLPNGMVWNQDNTLMYVADTLQRVIWVYDFDLPTGSISNRRIFFNFKTHPGINPWEAPDGIAVDSEYNLWVAVILGARVIQVNGQTGKHCTKNKFIVAGTIMHTINTGVNWTLSVAFGGKNYKELFVTNGDRNLETYQAKISQPNIGRVLKFEADYICGRPAYKVILPPNHHDHYPEKQLPTSDVDFMYTTY